MLQLLLYSVIEKKAKSVNAHMVKCLYLPWFTFGIVVLRQAEIDIKLSTLRAAENWSQIACMCSHTRPIKLFYNLVFKLSVLCYTMA